MDVPAVLADVIHRLCPTVAQDEITPEARLRDDVGIDSLGFIELIDELEDLLGIEFTDYVLLAEVHTIADLITAIESAEKRSRGRPA